MKIKIIRVEKSEDYGSSYNDAYSYLYPTEWDEVTNEEYEALKDFYLKQNVYKSGYYLNYIVVTEVELNRHFLDNTVKNYLKQIQEHIIKQQELEELNKKKKEEAKRKREEKAEKKLLAEKEKARMLYEKLKKEFE